MPSSPAKKNSLLIDIWQSFLTLPNWVKIWVGLWLAPINMLTLYFINNTSGLLITCLAYAGLLPNLFVMIYNRGFSRLMALPHLLPWTIMLGVIYSALPLSDGIYSAFLWALFITNFVSLVFDYPDTYKWFKGQKEVAGR
ncbi:hypothetical protein I6F65_18875 [Pseudoalteromonas sp. SWXJZ94C]|uniref:hypothetical protein n=1 Tax=Pseudoalteromonas sp. SWXJZ94C TaxID=2792065 RepID=UPI0018CEC49E|nr:hypothetical protein [Pseudoalteromonas sp. SWXJZ94C]MBH0059009.1 hypothetical protein [Pseudoalteromonas sp. SWXJZ94C]